jgi:TPP-dependent indolepyruvate ferredoxin oxidoreductase alpha subunit
MPMKARALANLADVRDEAERSPLNLVVDYGNARRGIITMGLPYLSLLDVLESTEKIPIRRVLEGFGVESIFETDTYNQKQLAEMVRQALAVKGFSVVIARHPCMLKFTRQARRKPGYQLRQVGIDQNACRRLHACVAEFGCPTFTRDASGRIDINADLCIGDGSCIRTCASQAITSPKIVASESKWK